MGTRGICWESIDSFPFGILWLNIPFCRKAEVSPFTWSLSSSLLHPLSSPRPKHSGVQYALNESSWWDSEANNSITEPSTRQEPCLGTIQSWGLLNPHAGFVTIFARLGDYVMCLRTQLGSSEMGSRGQVFCLPYLVFTQHSIISTFFPQHSNDQKKKVVGWPKSLFIWAFHSVLPKKPERTFWHIIFVLHSYDYNVSG